MKNSILSLGLLLATSQAYASTTYYAGATWSEAFDIAGKSTAPHVKNPTYVMLIVSPTGDKISADILEEKDPKAPNQLTESGFVFSKINGSWTWTIPAGKAPLPVTIVMNGAMPSSISKELPLGKAKLVTKAEISDIVFHSVSEMQLENGKKSNSTITDAGLVTKEQFERAIAGKTKVPPKVPSPQNKK